LLQARGKKRKFYQRKTEWPDLGKGGGGGGRGGDTNLRKGGSAYFGKKRTSSIVAEEVAEEGVHLASKRT